MSIAYRQDQLGTGVLYLLFLNEQEKEDKFWMFMYQVK